MTVAPTRWTVEERSSPSPDRLAADLRAGLATRPVTIPPKWFYDEKGSALFDAITQLPEYYPTRTEEAILRAHARDLPRVDTLVELGAGYSRKTRLLLEALTEGGRPLLFVPLDVAVEPLREAAQRITADFPSVTVHGVVADFDDELGPLPGEPGSRLVAFLGSTIGNLTPVPRAAFLARLHRATAPGDVFLLGADLVKDADRLVRAYDDSAGLTAAFNKNVLDVLARELDADLDPADFDHVAVYNTAEERIEMRLRARRDVSVPVRALDLVWELAQGEEVLTETSAKFRPEGVCDELGAAGFEVVEMWTDSERDFSLTLSQHRSQQSGGGYVTLHESQGEP
ncbi:MAG TPA: L-histidine N(alpha)-methyltransferase [Mycobacteriales bacterium]|nr:L-histidine N(alpha)-methyltransferase [Mycobacteriales bacterium]